MKLARLFFSVLFSAFTTHVISAEESYLIKHYQQQERYEFGLKLLELALSKTNAPYKLVSPQDIQINEARGERMVISGELDLQWISTTNSREEKMIPVKIPIYRGILGLRLLLVTKENHSEISKLRSIDGLREYTGGHGRHWGDLPVYAANQLTVVTNTSYSNLFKQLKKGHFDYFHRGLNEVWVEQLNHSSELVIADRVMLFYQHPIYFFVGKHRPELAEKIKDGLKISIEDGSFEKLFLNEFTDIIQKGKLNERNLIILKNPVVPDGTPDIDTSWWLPSDAMELSN